MGSPSPDGAVTTPEARARRIRLAVFDVDGVMTDGTIYLTDSGEQLKGFNSRDGLGMRLLQDSGVRVALLTGRRSRCVEWRARELGIAHVAQGVSDKSKGMLALLTELGVSGEEASFMGDDVMDLPAMRHCGFRATVPEAPELVRQHADYITRAGGGRGAVREFCEYIMRSQGTFEDQMSRFVGPLSS